jgi:hypothetical protein
MVMLVSRYDCSPKSIAPKPLVFRLAKVYDTGGNLIGGRLKAFSNKQYLGQKTLNELDHGGTKIAYEKG